MTKILHVIQILTLGGAARALIATARCSARQGSFTHTVVSLLPAEEKAARLAAESGLRILSGPDRATLEAEMAAADIVQVHWWNVHEVTGLLRSRLPEMRLMGFFHVAGDRVPHVITPKLLDFLDMSVPCNPYTYYDTPLFRDMEPERKLSSAGLVYGAADFDRLEGFRPKGHDGFNVGYIGTLDFIKMHPDYVKMSADIRIPDVKFLVYGEGSLDILRKQAADLGAAGRFEFRGYVDDVRSAIAEFDVYGYPLCEETYAGSELNLQEVMYAGLAPVVFPYGGVKRLVVNDFTGLIVHSAREYRQAVEFLYHHPAERLRMGRNAKAYAAQIFGAENAARKLNALYGKMLDRPKRRRDWPGAAEIGESGSAAYLDSLGALGGAYAASRAGKPLSGALEAEQEIARTTRLNLISGILAYRGRYPADPFLRYWAGLAFEKAGATAEAAVEYLEAFKAGFPDWRAGWRLIEAARAMARADLAQPVLMQLENRHPAWRRELEEARRGSPSGAEAARPAAALPASAPEGSASAKARDWTPEAAADPAHDAEVLEAEGLFRDGDADGAKRRLLAILGRRPGHARALNDLGVIAHSQGDSKEARSRFLEAVKADPEYAGATVNLSQSLTELGLNQEALGLCYRFLDAHPENREVLSEAASLEESWCDAMLARSHVRDLNYRKKAYRVTALVSTYKSHAFIRECLEDLEGQSAASELEIIVVDANSPQDENSIVEEFQRRYDNIRYIRTPERIGIYPAWNLAARLASGAYLTPFSTNDRLNPDCYRILMDALDAHPDVALVYGDTYLTNHPHESWGRHTPSPDYGGVFRWPDYSFEDLMTNCRVGPHPMWRREMHEAVGYFDGRYKAIGDQDFWLRVGVRHKLLHLPVFTGLAWITKESLSGESSSMGEILDIQRKHTMAYLRRMRGVKAEQGVRSR